MISLLGLAAGAEPGILLSVQDWAVVLGSYVQYLCPTRGNIPELDGTKKCKPILLTKCTHFPSQFPPYITATY